MGKLDTLTKEYMKRPDIFADVFNQFLYHGKQVIVLEQLIELDTTEITVPYGMDNRLVQRCLNNSEKQCLIFVTGQGGGRGQCGGIVD
ncbi:MAG: hypothetical protein K2P73_04965 [Lachnospiraceae bacterium]|nr:hypothetical protein [Lachnospiraceae bacterium]